jgi:hypothetical protein
MRCVKRSVQPRKATVKLGIVFWPATIKLAWESEAALPGASGVQSKYDPRNCFTKPSMVGSVVLRQSLWFSFWIQGMALCLSSAGRQGLLYIFHVALVLCVLLAGETMSNTGIGGRYELLVDGTASH